MMAPPPRPGGPERSGAFEVERRVADAVGRLLESWGFPRITGRIWAVLYLSPRALTAAELRERLHLSTGATSMALAELRRWGAITRLSRTGHRRQFFRAETDLLRLLSSLVQERGLRVIEQVIGSLEVALNGCSPTPEGAGAGYERHQIDELVDFAHTGHSLLTALIESKLMQGASRHVAGALPPSHSEEKRLTPRAAPD